MKDVARWWSREDLLLIALVGLLFFLPGLGPMGSVGPTSDMPYVQLFDKDEPRFSEAGRQMMLTGDYLVPRFNGQLRPDKPPLLYWLMQISYWLVDVNELGARLPSVVCGTLTLFVVYWIAGRRFGRLTGILAALMLASNALFIAESRLATADATMILFNTMALGCAWIAWESGNPRGDGLIIPKAVYRLDRGAHAMLDHVPEKPARMNWGLALLFWVALAAGTLAKGVPLLFTFLPMIVLSIATGALAEELARWRREPGGWGTMLAHLPAVLWRCVIGGNWSWWRQLRPAIGFPLLIALVGAWPAAVIATGHGELIRAMIAQQVNRVMGHDVVSGASVGNGYRKFFGFYFVAMWGTFWPWSVLLVPASYHCTKRMLGKVAIAIDPKPYQFLFAWVVPAWIVYECIASKLVHYVLPLYVAMIIVCADMLSQSWGRLTEVLAAKWFGAMRWVMLGLWVAFAVAALPGVQLLTGAESVSVASMVLAGALLAAGVAGTITWNKPAWPFATVLGWAGVLLIANTIILPAIPGLRVTQRVCNIMNAAGPRFTLLASGFDEPTLVFYTRGNIHIVAGPTLMRLWHEAAEREGIASLDPATGTEARFLLAVVNDETLRYLRTEFPTLEPIATFDGLWQFRMEKDPEHPGRQRKKIPRAYVIATHDPFPTPATGPALFEEIQKAREKAATRP